MALQACAECGGKVSDQAVACPHCGAPVAPVVVSTPAPAIAQRPRQSITAMGALGLSILIITTVSVATCNFGATPEKTSASPPIRPAAPTEKTAEQARKDREINIVLAGANRLKASMKKPETFKLTRAIMIDGKVICYEYTARNSWNDQASEHYVISDTVSTSRTKEWNALCAGKTGDDYTSVRAVMN